ncbi:uncharacterized protein B0T15DRAFT_324865 [Chaetomium strumarium]|uniref:Uncharacterized protein n=1 Tax=Chaetomium strumarium TaxID=1170767 RepID=A0AAJ0GL11_9PEZI|nr:hypothetical protein B0T15DRAFT_324865 [Chaetomium strumarium]
MTFPLHVRCRTHGFPRRCGSGPASGHNGWLFLFEDHIVPKFFANKDLVSDLKQASAFWVQDIDTVVKAKVEDEERYQAELRSLFSSQGHSTDSSKIPFENKTLP